MAKAQRKTRYTTQWRNKFLTTDAKSIGGMIKSLEGAVATLKAMQADGVKLDKDGGVGDDYAHLITTDPAIAKKYGMSVEAGEDDDD